MRDWKLERGRIVSVTELYQRGTYAEVLAGEPGPFATELPPVACIAVLESVGFDGEPSSSLTIAWFQDHLAPPFPQEVERYVRSLDWEAVAAAVA